MTFKVLQALGIVDPLLYRLCFVFRVGSLQLSEPLVNGFPLRRVCFLLKRSMTC